jgi:predicted GIY-YIG superfamily endonuclease
MVYSLREHSYGNNGCGCSYVDPRDNMIRYAGLSDDVKSRYHEHLSRQAERADSVATAVVDVALL